MGYIEQMGKLHEVYVDALNSYDIPNLPKSGPIIAVGSGGSYPVAVLASTILGGFSITPYMYKPVKNMKTLLISASGKGDVASLQTGNEYLFTMGTSHKRDGFLATLSTMTMATLLARFYSKDKLDIELTKPKIIKHTDQPTRITIILHGKWGACAAYDMYTKMVESGISIPIIMDYRNFCHGVHQFYRRHMDAAMVFFIDPECVEVAKFITNTIPDFTPFIIETQSNNIKGALELLYGSMLLVGSIAGKHNNISGPKVKKWQRKLYHADQIMMGMNNDDESPLKNKELNWQYNTQNIIHTQTVDLPIVATHTTYKNSYKLHHLLEQRIQDIENKYNTLKEEFKEFVEEYNDNNIWIANTYVSEEQLEQHKQNDKHI